AALNSAAAAPRPAGGEYTFHHDHVIGTSLDLCVAAPDEAAAVAAEQAVLDEVERLRGVLSTYDPASELSRLNRARGPVPVSPGWHLDAADVVTRTTDRPLDLNALGKAYIIEKAAGAVRRAVPAVTGLLLNIGGDVLAWGAPPGGTGWAVGVQDPFRHFDNAA